MPRVFLDLPQGVYDALWAHLLPRRSKFEEAAFVYVVRETSDGTDLFRYLDWSPVLSDGFLSQSPFYFELTDEARASVIKRAHDLGASLVEFHSHTGPWPARFSPSDLLGFQEFVPHVWWRLKGQPYLAVVVTRSAFDGLAWITGPDKPQHLDGIAVGPHVLKPTGLSSLGSDPYGE